MGKPRSTGTQIRKFVKSAIQDRQTKYKMGHGHFLHPYQGGGAISVYDPRSVRQQYCGLQGGIQADCEPCTGHDPAGNEE